MRNSTDNKNKIKAKKEFGQNFLTNDLIIKEFVTSLSIENNDFIIEIGGGSGALTKEIIKFCNKYLKLFVFEIDDGLIKFLKDIVKDCDNSHIQHKDFLNVKLDKLYEPYRKQANYYKIIGSIPYNITSPIIHKILKLKYRPDTILLIIQKEVGDKIIENAPNGSYWSNIILGYKPTKLFKIHRNEFYPSPKVDSVAIKLVKDKNTEKIINEIGFDNWSKFLHHVFKNPRKMIKKAFNEKLLKSANINPNDRPQHIDQKKLISLYNLIYKNRTQ